MTREELEKDVRKLFEELLLIHNVPLPLWDAEFEKFGLECAKLGVRYGFEKAREWKTSESKTSSVRVVDSHPKYKSSDEVLAELDKEQDDKR